MGTFFSRVISLCGLVALFCCQTEAIDRAFIEDQIKLVEVFVESAVDEIMILQNLLRFCIGTFLMFVCFWVWKNDLSNLDGK